MRYSVNRTRASAAVAVIALAAATLTGCDKLKPAGQIETMSLLKDGSDKVCVAADVQAALRKALLPDVTHSTDTTSLDQRQKALATISLSYELTALQSFDKAVSKATCTTTVNVSGIGDGASRAASKFKLTYEISPSADKPGTFIVNVENADVTAYANNLLGNAIDDAVAKHILAEEQAQDAQKHAQLLAIVNDKWMVGYWVDTGTTQPDCTVDGEQYLANHTMGSSENEMKWRLNGDQLDLKGISDPEQHIISTITHATPTSFTEQSADGETTSWRRCTKAELTGQ